nr:glycosyltransferase family 2 protein [Acholeplasmatales bacterium]
IEMRFLIMENILDIIIPIYNTPEEYLVRALKSIIVQKGIDFNILNVIIVDDASKKNKYKKSWFKQRFPKLKITYLVNKENVGPGVSRQNAIDAGNGKYITFLDSDDEFLGTDIFPKVLSVFEEFNVDKIFTKVNEETIINGVFYNITHDFKTLDCLHGLFLRRSFLDEYSIRFDEKLRIHEDFYFVRLVNGFSVDSRAFIDQVSYNWKWNNQSLMRSNKKIYNHLEDEFYAIFKTNSIFEKNKIDYLEFYIGGMCSLYLVLASNLFDYEEYRDLKPQYVELFRSNYDKDKFDKYGLEKLHETIQLKFNAQLRIYNWFKVKESFEDFIKKI